ncbi:MAG: ABC transporter permease [Planctomycetaceae bacterium]|nr:ABC transporter permease [Planctomycetaceae bacterium]
MTTLGRLSAKKGSATDFIAKYGLYCVFILLVLIMTLSHSAFLTIPNVRNILLQVSINGILAVGMTMVIVTGGIDLSAGSMLAFAGVVATSIAHPGQSFPLAIVIGLFMGFLLGAVNGFLVAYGRIVPFIVTLGMTTIARGMALTYANGRPIINLMPSFKFLGQGTICYVPVPVLFLFLALAVGYVILNKSVLGRYLLATGGNEDAAIASGVSTKKVKFFAYSFMGLMCGLSSILLAGRTNAGAPNAGVGYELDAIAAVVVGGASLTGGRGTIAGTLMGVLIIGVIQNGLDILNVSSYIQLIVKGLIIISAVWMDQKSNK